MPTANQRPRNISRGAKLGGSRTSSTETPVSSAEQPDPPKGDNTPATRLPPQSFDPFPTPALDGDPLEGKPTGRDHPDESEHDHRHQKLHGESDKRLKQGTPKR